MRSDLRGRLAALAAASLVVGVAAVGGAAPRPPDRAATAVAEISLPQPVVVLQDGTVLRARQVKRTATSLLVTTSDGGRRTIPLDQVDLEASRHLPGVPRVRNLGGTTARPTGRRGLAAYARATTLTIPGSEDSGGSISGDAAKGRLILATARPDDVAVEEKPPSASAQDPGEAAEARRAAEELAGSWRAFREAEQAMLDRCTGYTAADGGGCGGPKVVSRRRTADCQDAVRQAEARLSGLVEAQTDVYSLARRGGLAPGEARSLMRQHGLLELRRGVEQARARLDAWKVD